jgi:hypothetical protein
MAATRGARSFAPFPATRLDGESTFCGMFSIVVIAVAVGVFTMYFRHELQLRRKRRAELAPHGDDSPPPSGDASH